MKCKEEAKESAAARKKLEAETATLRKYNAEARMQLETKERQLKQLMQELNPELQESYT